MNHRCTTVAVGCVAGMLLTGAARAGLSVSGPYTVSTFATAPAGATAPDDVSVGGGHVFVGFGNGGAPDGSDGKSSTVAEYNLDGSLVQTFSLPGHTDGVRYNPSTGLLWVDQNEDANARLVVINPSTGVQTNYTFSSAAHGGGYDDIVFRSGQAYFAASNPSLNAAGVNTGPALVSGSISGNQVAVTPVLKGNAAATDVASGKSTSLNLTDPDSMTVDRAGNIVLDSQQDAVLAIVHNPGSSQSVSQIALKSSVTGAPLTVDDTIFTPGVAGKLLLADSKANVIYSISVSSSEPAAFSASPDDGLLSQLNAGTGVLTPVISGLGSPKGLAFIPGGATAVPLPNGFAAGFVGMVLAGGAMLLRRRQMSR